VAVVAGGALALLWSRPGQASGAGNTLTAVDGDPSEYPSVAVGTDGLPVVSYFDNDNNVKVAHCGNAACSAGNTLTAVDSAAGAREQSSIAVGADGLPLVSYHDGLNLKVAHCGNVACSAGNALTIVDSSLDVG